MAHQLALLPPKIELETKKVLKQLVRSHRALAELKGYAEIIPNPYILTYISNPLRQNSPIF